MILGSALMMLTVGCTTDTTKEVVNNDNKVIIGLSVDDTRTSLGDKSGTEYPVLWSAGDKVAVNGVASEPLAAEYAGKTAAQFTVTGVAAPFDVIYPADVLMADGKTVGISEIQEYVPGSFAQGSAVMVGHSDSPNGVIKNLYGFVKVPILKGDEKTVKSVTLHSNNLEAMTGTFAVDYVNAALEPLSGMDFVKVTAAEGIPFVEDKAEVVIAVPAGTYANGFTVKIVATDGTAMTAKAYTANGITIDAGTLLAMPEVQFYPNETVSEITDAAQLQAFLSAASAGAYDNFKNENGEVLLGSDIDMTGVTLTSATQFDGVFNGQGYALKNWKSDGVALFAANSGTIKNVVLDESCELTIAAGIGTFGFLVNTNKGNVAGCANDANIEYSGDISALLSFGSLVGSSSGLVTNCINNGDILFNLVSVTANNYIGGIVGQPTGAAGQVIVSNCINNGNIKIDVNNSTRPKHIYMGGVAGTTKIAKLSATSDCGKIENCINNGDVGYSYGPTGGNGTYANIGGVIGYLAGNIENCSNSGNVNYEVPTGAASTRPAVGGVAGCVIYSASDCHNSGTVRVKGAFAAGTADAAGAGGKHWVHFGGVFGSIGKTNEDTTLYMNNCSNSGDLHFEGLMLNTNGTAYTYGGVAGYCGVPVSNCKNEGLLSVISYGNKSYTGGVFGYGPVSKISGCENNGTIIFDMGITAQDNKRSEQTYTGGIVGYNAAAANFTIENCGNGKNGIVTIENGWNTAAFSYAGGIYGSASKGSDMKACYNDGLVTSNAPMAFRAGGLCGAHSGTMTDCINRGTVTLNNGAAAAADKPSTVAGLSAHIGSTVVNCQSLGAIINNSNAGTLTGGLFGTVGNTAYTWSGCEVNCPITSVAGTDVGILLGGQIIDTTKKADEITTHVGTAESPIIIKGSTTINGIAVTAADCADKTKLVGLQSAPEYFDIVNVQFAE